MGKRAAVADKAQADKANEKSKEVTCDVPDWLKKLQAFAESCSLQSESTEVAAVDKIALKVANETMAGAEVVTSIKKLPFFFNGGARRVPSGGKNAHLEAPFLFRACDRRHSPA